MFDLLCLSRPVVVSVGLLRGSYQMDRTHGSGCQAEGCCECSELHNVKEKQVGESLWEGKSQVGLPRGPGYMEVL